MKTNFIVNDYILIWNLLFGASISESIYKLKQKIWLTYKTEYNNIHKDKELIMKDYRNFIPDDDTVYNIILESKEYEKIKRNAEKYRLEIMKIWDKNIKNTEYLLKKIIRKSINECTFFIVEEELNIIEYYSKNNIIIGKRIDKNYSLNILLDINYELINKKIKEYPKEHENIKKAILELAIYNEYATKIVGSSCYQGGSPALLEMKKHLYPYWLMYLGIPKEQFEEYMMRDKIGFDTRKYPYEKEFKKMNIEEFIDFCIRNQRYMLRTSKEKIETL